MNVCGRGGAPDARSSVYAMKYKDGDHSGRRLACHKFDYAHRSTSAAEVQFFGYGHKIPEGRQLEVAYHTHNVSIFLLLYIGQSANLCLTVT